MNDIEAGATQVLREAGVDIDKTHVDPHTGPDTAKSIAERLLACRPPVFSQKQVSRLGELGICL